MVFRREGAYGLVAVLMFIVFSVLLFAVPAWSAQEHEKRVSEAEKDRIEGLSEAQAQEEFAQAMQAITQDSSGDLVETE